MNVKKEPLSSGEHAKVFTFFIHLAPSVFLFFGIIPAIFIFFGIFLMKKGNRFSSIEVSVNMFKGVFWLFISFLVAGVVFVGDIESEALIILVGISLSYIISVHHLFLSPLKRHSEWVSENGIFTTQERSYSDSWGMHAFFKKEDREVYNVDELERLSKLKKDGDISEDEFERIKKNIIYRK